MRRFAFVPLACAALAACTDSVSPPDMPALAPSASRGSSEGGILELGVLPDMSASAAYGMNNKGQVVGFSSSPDGAATAFLWTPSKTGSGTMTPLPGPAGYGNTYAFAINDADPAGIAGAAVSAASEVRAVVWQGGTMRDLGTLPGGDLSVGLGINNGGQVVGYSTAAAGGRPRAFLYTPDHGMQDLGTLGGAESMAMDINSSGQVVGTAQTSEGAAHAFLWSRRGGMQRLPVGPGARESAALALNNAGDIVGYAVMTDNTTRAYVWLQSKGAYRGVELEGLVPAASSIAFAINKQGVIVGYSSQGSDPAGQDYRAVSWKRNPNGVHKQKAESLQTPSGAGSTYGQAVTDGGRGKLKVAGIMTSPAGVSGAILWR